jgi:hypothetical protein
VEDAFAAALATPNGADNADAQHTAKAPSAAKTTLTKAKRIKPPATTQAVPDATDASVTPAAPDAPF